jgi:hypothetical protein
MILAGYNWILVGYVSILAEYIADSFQCNFSTISIGIESSHAQPHKMSHRRSQNIITAGGNRSHVGLSTHPVSPFRFVANETKQLKNFVAFH